MHIYRDTLMNINNFFQSCSDIVTEKLINNSEFSSKYGQINNRRFHLKTI